MTQRDYDEDFEISDEVVYELIRRYFQSDDAEPDGDSLGSADREEWHQRCRQLIDEINRRADQKG